MRRVALHRADAEIDARLAEIHRHAAAHGYRSCAGCAHCRSVRDRRRWSSSALRAQPRQAARRARRRPRTVRKSRRRIVMLKSPRANFARARRLRTGSADLQRLFQSVLSRWWPGRSKPSPALRLPWPTPTALSKSPASAAFFAAASVAAVVVHWLRKRAGFLVGGFGRGIGRLVIGLGAAAARGRRARDQQHERQTAMDVSISFLMAALPDRRSAGRC